MARHRQRHQRRGQHRVSRAHHRQQVAVPDAVAHHAEHRRHQRADITAATQHREQQYRPGLDQHVPAEDERLHLERPRGEQIGGPLKTIISDAEWCERGRPRGPAEVSMPRFIAFHPARFLIVAAVWIASVSRRFKPPIPPYCDAKPGVRRTSAADIGAAEDGQQIPLLLGLHAFRRRRHVARSRRRRLKTAVLRNGEPIINRKPARPSPVDAKKARFRAVLLAQASAGHFCQNKSCPRCCRFSRP